MNPLFQAGDEIQKFMQEQQWPFCFIGGLTVLCWGEVRMTQDVDLSLLTGFGTEAPYVDKLLSSFESRINGAKAFALENRILLLSAKNGVPIDISLAGLPFEEQVIQRAIAFEFDKGCCLMVCSPEDLIVLKAFANRSRDWMDIEGIVIRQEGSLDVFYIMEQVAPLAEVKESPEIINKLKLLLKIDIN